LIKVFPSCFSSAKKKVQAMVKYEELRGLIEWGGVWEIAGF
jgi:hypothetical protein